MLLISLLPEKKLFPQTVVNERFLRRPPLKGMLYTNVIINVLFSNISKNISFKVVPPTYLNDFLDESFSNFCHFHCS